MHHTLVPFSPEPITYQKTRGIPLARIRSSDSPAWKELPEAVGCNVSRRGGNVGQRTATHDPINVDAFTNTNINLVINIDICSVTTAWR